jgi:hypothetical protein
MDGVCPSLKALEGQDPLAEIVEPASADLDIPQPERRRTH